MSVIQNRRRISQHQHRDHDDSEVGNVSPSVLSLHRDASATTDSGPSSYPLTVMDDAEEEEEVVSSRLPLSLNLMDIFTLPVSPSMKKNVERNLDGWRDDIESFKEDMVASCPDLPDTLRATGETLDDAMISRWVKARGNKALESLQEHAAWRLDFVGRNPHGVLEASIQEILDAHVMFLQGNDIQGYPVLLFLAKRYDAARFSEVISPCMVYAMDGALLSAETPDKRRTKVVFDLSSVNRKNVSIEFLESIFSILQTHYPNCLHTLYFVDAPFLFWAIWGCVSAFLSAETRSKIEFVSKNSNNLVSGLGPHVLPDVYQGGCSPWRPVQQSVQIIRHGGQVCHHTCAGSIENEEPYMYTQITAPMFSVRSVLFWIFFILATCLWGLVKIVL